MNCSDALLEAVAKYAFEIGLKPLTKIELISTNQIRGSIAVSYRRSEIYISLREQILNELTFICRILFRNRAALDCQEYVPLRSVDRQNTLTKNIDRHG